MAVATFHTKFCQEKNVMKKRHRIYIYIYICIYLSYMLGVCLCYLILMNLFVNYYDLLNL